MFSKAQLEEDRLNFAARNGETIFFSDYKKFFQKITKVCGTKGISLDSNVMDSEIPFRCDFQEQLWIMKQPAGSQILDSINLSVKFGSRAVSLMCFSLRKRQHLISIFYMHFNQSFYMHFDALSTNGSLLTQIRGVLAEVGTSANRSANPQSNRQCCLIRGKTAWKKWTLLFSGLEVNVRELMTFFFYLEVNVWSMAKFYLQK